MQYCDLEKIFFNSAPEQNVSMTQSLTVLRVHCRPKYVNLFHRDKMTDEVSTRHLS